MQTKCHIMAGFKMQVGANILKGISSAIVYKKILLSYGLNGSLLRKLYRTLKAYEAFLRAYGNLMRLPPPDKQDTGQSTRCRSNR